MKCTHITYESPRWTQPCRLNAVVVRDEKAYCKRHDPMRMKHRGLKRASLMDLAFSAWEACEVAWIKHKTPETEHAMNLASDLMAAIPNDTDWIDECAADEEYVAKRGLPQ